MLCADEMTVGTTVGSAVEFSGTGVLSCVGDKLGCSVGSGVETLAGTDARSPVGAGVRYTVGSGE